MKIDDRFVVGAVNLLCTTNFGIKNTLESILNRKRLRDVSNTE